MPSRRGSRCATCGATGSTAEEARKRTATISQDQHRKLQQDIQTLTDADDQAHRRHAGAEGQGDPSGLMPWQIPSRSSPPQPPAHVAIIMDGNGRWAKARGLPRIAGHRRGAEAVRRTVVAATELGIRYLTLFGFSSENWKRPLDEVHDLMGLLRHYLRGEIAELHQQGRAVPRHRRPHAAAGRHRHADRQCRGADPRQSPAQPRRSRCPMAGATRSRRRRAASPRRSPPAASPPRRSTRRASDAICSPPAFPIPISSSAPAASSGSAISCCGRRAYAELVFTDTLWPDFGKADLENAVRDFHGRERRYGASVGSR